MIGPLIRSLIGTKRAIVWDLDGTLFDPRPRMLQTVRTFGVDAALADVHGTWQATADALGLDREKFFAHWNDHFWDPQSFASDEPIEETVWYARWAQSIGIENVVVTGRTGDNDGATREQLARIALSPSQVIFKPAVGVSTPEFKARQIAALGNAGAFITDSPDEIRALDGSIPCVLVEERPPLPPGDLLPSGYALSPWIVHEVAREIGRDLSNVVVDGPIKTRVQFEQIFPGAFDALDRVRRAACEHLLNDREGKARVLDGDLDPRYARGDLFALPMVRAEHLVALGAGDIDALPVHPQERVHHDGEVVREIMVRATASGRTVRAHDTLMKCDLSHVFMDRHRRSLTLRDAELAIRNSNFLAATDLLFFPETFAVGDKQKDVACIFRSPTPNVPGVDGSWSIPAFCLFAPAQEFASDPLARRFHARGVLIDRIVLPLIDTMLKLALDLGCSFIGHGQNIHVEIGPDALPTGRVILADMEDLWPHPELATSYPVDHAYLAAQARSAEADIAGTFQDYFLWKLMHPLFRCVEPSAPEVRLAGVERMVNEVRRREARARSHPALSWFAALATRI